MGSDSLLWFFDNLSETLSELIKTSLEAIRLSNANAAYFQELTDRGSNADKFDESIH